MNEKLLSGREAARQIGVHYNTFYHWVEKGKIPFVNTAAAKKYRQSDITRWIERNSKNQPIGSAELFVTTADIPRTPLVHLSPVFNIRCRLGKGWELWDNRYQVAGESEGGWLVLDVAGFVICDSRTKSVLLSSTQAEGPTS